MNFSWICLPARSAAVVFYFVLSSWCGSVFAFSVETLVLFGVYTLPGTPVHEKLTRDATALLPPFYLSSGQAVTFSDRAITEIADYNAKADAHVFAEEVHFDGESFEAYPYAQLI